MSKSNLKFKLGQQVQIKVSSEVGEVVGHAEYLATENTYYLRYKSADGRAVQAWWDDRLPALQKMRRYRQGSPRLLP